MFELLKKLRNKQITGINSRNLDLVYQYNDRENIRIVDDKIKSKNLAKQHNIAVPELYGVIHSAGDCEQLQSIIADHNAFVLKPTRGSGGKGIIIINETIKSHYRQSSGKILKLNNLQEHVLNILSGIYSLGGSSDTAMIEYRVEPHHIFDKICLKGVPDLRIIVFKGFPMMAMLRLPTLKSEGKANLHQGAIGVGIDIQTGITTRGSSGNAVIELHPDTLEELAGIALPQWDKILEISAGCYELSQLGYLGVDLVMDKTHGPMLLEFNARPGLNIQIANNDGIGRRVGLLLDYADKNLSVAERVSVSKQLLGNRHK